MDKNQTCSSPNKRVDKGTYLMGVDRNNKPFVENDYHKITKNAEQEQHL